MLFILQNDEQGEGRMKKLYLATTLDEYELPIAVADTSVELARKMGVTKYSIMSVISHARQHKYCCMYHKVVYTEEEWNDEDRTN